MLEAFSTSIAPHLRNGCSYILDNFSYEWAVSLYNIVENRIFHRTVIHPEFSSDAESLQAVFSAASIAWVIYDIYTLKTMLMPDESFETSWKAWAVVACVAAVTYIANRFFNWWYPAEEDCQKMLTIEIPEKDKQKVSVSLMRPKTTSGLQPFYLARIFLNMCLAFASPHKIPYIINVLCQIHTLSTVMKIRWLKLSRTFSYLTREECYERLRTLPDFQRRIADLILPENYDEIPEEEFEEFLNRLRQVQISDSQISFTFNFNPFTQQ